MNQRIQQEIVSEDNLVYRLKRPLHKQGLFWAALVSGIIIFLLALLSILLVITTIGLMEENDISSPSQATITRLWSPIPAMLLRKQLNFPADSR